MMRRMINIHTQKKNCRRCRAYISGQHHGNRCELGFKVWLMGYDEHGMTSFGVPKEKCPKPLTIKDFFYCMEHYTADQIRLPLNIHKVHGSVVSHFSGGTMDKDGTSL